MFVNIIPAHENEDMHIKVGVGDLYHQYRSLSFS